MAVPAPSLPPHPDILVIGAGAAGIAAARAVMAAGRSVVVLEARPRIGGRCVTDTARLGAVFDLGAAWLHNADDNPIVALAAEAGIPLADSDRLRRELTIIDGRPATAGEMAEYDAEWRAHEGRITARAASGLPDCSLAEAAALAGPWGPTIAAWQGDIISAAPAARISLADFAANALDGRNMLPDGGLGALLATFAHGLPIRLSAPVTRLEWGGREAVAEGDFGTIRARAVIATLPTSLLAAEAVRFDPPLPAETLQAAHDLPLGTVAKVGFAAADAEGPGADRLGLAPFTSVDRRIAAGEALVAMNAWPFGRPVLACHVGGDAAAALEREGDAALEAFMRAEITRRFGSATALRADPIVTDWLRDPFSRGVYSYARIGRAGARAVLAQPLAEGRLCLAGEACDSRLAGTLGGAWRSGVAAAAAALAALG
jgi:monoamine oxidase